MKYMLRMNAKRGSGGGEDWQIMVGPRGPQGAHRLHDALQRELKQSATSSEPRAGGPSQAKIVRAGRWRTGGHRRAVRGIEEFLAGYRIVDVESAQEAYDIAARASAAPGPGGAPMNMPIEVREVMSGPPPID